jgi:hypothetical protein
MNTYGKTRDQKIRNKKNLKTVAYLNHISKKLSFTPILIILKKCKMPKTNILKTLKIKFQNCKIYNKSSMRMVIERSIFVDTVTMRNEECNCTRYVTTQKSRNDNHTFNTLLRITHLASSRDFCVVT